MLGICKQYTDALSRGRWVQNSFCREEVDSRLATLQELDRTKKYKSECRHASEYLPCTSDAFFISRINSSLRGGKSKLLKLLMP